MARLARKNIKVFALNANVNDVGQFGSALETTKYNTKDVEQIQALESWDNGWVAAALSNNRYPSLQERNGVDYVITYQQAYLMQQGLPEWHNQTEYCKGSIVKQVVGDDIYFYRSIADNNIGHALSDTNYWQNYSLFNQTAILDELAALKARTYRIGEPIIRLDNTLYDDEIRLEGATVSRVTYAALFDMYGTKYGEGDGLTTFQLPDFRNRALWGSNTLQYIAAGLPNIKGQINPYAQWGGWGGGYSCGVSGWSGALINIGSGTITNRKETGGGYYGIKLDASLSNTIYGNSTTVQPPAITVRVVTRWK